MAYTVGAQHDRIVSLPGATSPLLSKQFSGFLQISKSKYIHYIYIESERDPIKDDLIFWTNGGPGCSGLLGLYTEMGPWRPMADGSLSSNPNSWTKMASMVFLEQPVGVGFSYSTDSSEMASSSDFQAAKDNLAVVKAYFARFPERSNNTFYVAGESYGGHYIPQWTLSIFNDGNRNLLKHFGGFLLGNPYTSFGSGSIAMANTLWGLQLVSALSWKSFTRGSCNLMSRSAFAYTDQCVAALYKIFDQAASLNPYALMFPVCTSSSSSASLSERSKGSVMFSSRQVQFRLRAFLKSLENLRLNHQADVNNSSQSYQKGVHTDEGPRISSIGNSGTSFHTDTKEYLASIETTAVLKPELVNEGPAFLDRFGGSAASTSSSGTSSKKGHRPREHATNKLLPKARHELYPSSTATRLPYDPCTSDYTESYLNRVDVQNALHVIPADIPSSHVNIPFSVCNDPIFNNWPLMDEYADTTSLFGVILRHKNKPPGFRMLIYSGDADSVCATVGTQEWVWNIPGAELLPGDENFWQPWTLHNGQLGGFLTRFNGSLSFATVHTAGHEVPAYQPEAALFLLASFLNGTLSGTGRMHLSPTTKSPVQFSIPPSAVIALIVFGVFFVLSICLASWMLIREKKRVTHAADGGGGVDGGEGIPGGLGSTAIEIQSEHGAKGGDARLGASTGALGSRLQISYDKEDHDFDASRAAQNVGGARSGSEILSRVRIAAAGAMGPSGGGPNGGPGGGARFAPLPMDISEHPMQETSDFDGMAKAGAGTRRR